MTEVCDGQERLRFAKGGVHFALRGLRVYSNRKRFQVSGRSLRRARTKRSGLRASAAGRLRPARHRRRHTLCLLDCRRLTEKRSAPRLPHPIPNHPLQPPIRNRISPCRVLPKFLRQAPYGKKPGRVINNSHRIIRFSAQRAPLRGRKLSTITVTFHCTEQCRRPQLLKTHKGMQNKYLTIKNPLSEAEKTPCSDCSQLGSRPATFNKRPSPNEKLSTIQ